jgi:hypothetical protein
VSAEGTVAEVLAGTARHNLHHGECLAWMRTLPAESVDAIVSDLPYAEIDRDYGRMTEAAWEEFAHAIVRESLRVLKPRGSAVYIVQPNSERVGRMRAWCFRFLAWCADDLVRETGGRVGIVQDAWWWNTTAPPTVHCQRTRGLMRPSVKPCVWVGAEDCYRSQDEVLWSESEGNAAARVAGRVLIGLPSGQTMDQKRCANTALERGGVTPFNLIPIANANSTESAGASGHGAGTPYDLAAWWVRYLCPKGGVVCDPCGGTMTMGLAAVRQGRRFLGCEKEAHHFAAGVERMSACDLDTSSPVRVAAPEWGDLFAPRGTT